MAGISWLGTPAAWLPASPIPFDKRSWPHIAHPRQSCLQFCCPLLKLLNRFLLQIPRRCLFFLILTYTPTAPDMSVIETWARILLNSGAATGATNHHLGK